MIAEKGKNLKKLQNFFKINQSGKHKPFNKKNRQEYPTFRDSIIILDNLNEETNILDKFIKNNDEDFDNKL